MSTARVFILTTIITLALAAPTAMWADDLYHESFDQTYSLAATGTVELSNINGNVTVTTWDRAEVRVQATKAASDTELLEKLKIEITATPERLTVDTDYPSTRSSWGRSSSMSVEYTLTVPATSRIDKVELVNGSLMLDGVEGGVRAESVNGALTLTNIGGVINLSTVNGRIKPTLENLDLVREVTLESVNGSIELAVPSWTRASVKAETVNGGIHNDFGLKVNKHKYVGADLVGDLSGGGITIKMETVNGSISLESM